MKEVLCPRLADVLAGRDPGPHDDSACGWCADIRLYGGPCICGTPGIGNFEGSQRDCSVHGDAEEERVDG